MAPASLPPGPRSPSALQTLWWWNRSIPFFERCRRRYGGRFTTRFLASPPFVNLTDPAEVKETFRAPPEVLHPGEGAKILEPVVGTHSVILLDEREHLVQRKLMLPAFHGERVQRLAGLVDEVAERAVAGWPAREPVALHPRLQALTLEVMLRGVLGLGDGPRLDALRERLTTILALGSRPIGMLPPLQRTVAGRGPWRSFLEVRAEADELLFALIDERRAGGGEGDDVLAMLLAARHENGQPMSRQELRDEVMTLLVAGHETTASALAWAFEYLARAPRVAARVREDGDAYLTATIQEVLRRRPVLPIAAPRYVVQEIEIGGWRYPAGSCLTLNAYLIHHDAALYPEPYAFRPERFLEEAPGTYTWIPFGGGRRRCLGSSFAMLEMQAVLRAVLARHEVAPDGDRPMLTRRRSISISPRSGAQVVLREREPAALPVAA